LKVGLADGQSSHRTIVTALGGGPAKHRTTRIVTLLGGSAAAWPLAARAQQREVPTIGWLHAQTLETNRPFMPAFHQDLAQAGYDEGRNVVIAHRWADGDADRRPARSASPSR